MSTEQMSLLKMRKFYLLNVESKEVECRDEHIQADMSWFKAGICGSLDDLL